MMVMMNHFHYCMRHLSKNILYSFMVLKFDSPSNNPYGSVHLRMMYLSLYTENCKEQVQDIHGCVLNEYIYRFIIVCL